jgi:hypothetical protein
MLKMLSLSPHSRSIFCRKGKLVSESSVRIEGKEIESNAVAVAAHYCLGTAVIFRRVFLQEEQGSSFPFL